MKKALSMAVAVALLALGAAQVLAIQAGTFECMGYTITVTPDDPENPSKSGTVTITKSDDYAEVQVTGTYHKETGKRPATIVEISGTITTPDGTTTVARTFTFSPGPQKTVWKTVISWLESEIAS